MIFICVHDISWKADRPHQAFLVDIFTKPDEAQDCEAAKHVGMGFIYPENFKWDLQDIDRTKLVFVILRWLPYYFYFSQTDSRKASEPNHESQVSANWWEKWENVKKKNAFLFRRDFLAIIILGSLSYDFLVVKPLPDIDMDFSVTYRYPSYHW